jgi:hypothetical protein
VSDEITKGMLRNEAEHAKRDALAALARAEASILDVRRLLEKDETGLNFHGEYARPLIDALTSAQRWATVARALEMLEIEARPRPAPEPTPTPTPKIRRKRTP